MRPPRRIWVFGLAAEIALLAASASQAGPAYVERLLRNSRQKAALERAVAALEPGDVELETEAAPLNPTRLSRDHDRDEIAAKLEQAGFPERLGE